MEKGKYKKKGQANNTCLLPAVYAGEQYVEGMKQTVSPRQKLAP